MMAYGTIDNGDGSDGLSTVIQPSSLPKFAGSLDLFLRAGVKPIIRRFLSLPDGIHFRKLILMWLHEGEVSLAAALVERCFHTLESLKITCDLPGAYARPISIQLLRPHSYFVFLAELGSALIDLSKVTRLKHAVFGAPSARVDWITMALRTITPEHRDLRQISVYLVYRPTQAGPGGSIRQILGEQIFGQWMELDHLLAQLWESHSIRPRALCYAPQGVEEEVAE